MQQDRDDITHRQELQRLLDEKPYLPVLTRLAIEHAIKALDERIRERGAETAH